MLQFWKRSGSTEKTKATPLSNSTPPDSPTFTNLNGVQHHSLTCRSGPLASFEDEELFDLCETEIPKSRSRLSKSLDEVLEDKGAVSYFAQYLEVHGGLPLIHCWLAIEQFKLEVEKTLKEELNEAQTCLSSTKVDHDSLSVSTDCDSYTADSYSLCDYPSDIIKHAQCDKVKVDVSNHCDRSSCEASHIENSTNELLSSRHSEDTVIKCDRSPLCNKYMQRLVEQALKIFKTYVSLEASESIKCPEEARQEIIENICDTSKVLRPNCFDKVEHFIRDVMEKDYFQVFLESDYFCRYQIDVLTSGNVVLDDILYNETALFYFMEFLEQENNRSLLEFWIAASNFHMQLNEQKEMLDPAEAQNDAVVLYDKYFSLQAHCPLGFRDKIRFAVEQNICGENGVMLDCFHLPIKIVEQVLEKNYLKPFIASQLFFKYLSELINSVSNSSSNSQEGNKYSPSECSSEKSFSTNSTFLAFEIPRSHQKYKKDKGTDMHIDTRQLYDPDSLWRRKKHHRLSFGRVTALGKYETDVEPEPDNRVSSRIRTAMKKFVSEEDKRKEEMAWQVAEMIIKDITNITLQDNKELHS